MRTLNISISDKEYLRLGIQSENLSFSDFVSIISQEITRDNHEKCVDLAEKYGLSEMSMEDITNEVRQSRRSAKHYN